MVSDPPVVVYDACVLYPFHLRNLLIQLAVRELPPFIGDRNRIRCCCHLLFEQLMHALAAVIFELRPVKFLHQLVVLAAGKNRQLTYRYIGVRNDFF